MKLFCGFFWTRRHPMGRRSTWGCSEGSTTHQGTLGGPGGPWWVVPTSGAPWIASLLYKYANISTIPLGFLEYCGIYRANRQSRGHPRWAQPTRARLGLLACPGGLCLPRGTPQAQPGPIMFLLVQFFFVKFRCIGTPFDIDVQRFKKHPENNNWHLALCQ